MAKPDIDGETPLAFIPIAKMAKHVARLRSAFRRTHDHDAPPLPVVWNLTAFKKSQPSFGLGVCVEDYLAFEDSMKQKGEYTPALEFISARAFQNQAQSLVKSEEALFSADEERALCVTMKKSGDFAATCFVVLSPALAEKFQNSELDYSSIFRADCCAELLEHLDGVKPRKGKMPSDPKVVSTIQFARKTDEREEAFRDIREGRVVWLDDYSIAMVDCDTALKLKATLFPNICDVIKPFGLIDLAEEHADVFNLVREGKHFARIADLQHKKDDRLCTIIPAYAARYLITDKEGYVIGMHEPQPLDREFTTRANIRYDGNGSAHVTLTDQLGRQRERNGQSYLAKAISPKTGSAVKYALNAQLREPTGTVELQGRSFEVKRDQPPSTTVDTDYIFSVDEAAHIQTRLSPQGDLQHALMGFTRQSDVAQMILGRAQEVTVRCQGREFILEPAEQ